MSDVSRGPGWWLASDGKWYPPEAHPAASPQPSPQAVPPNYPPSLTPPAQPADVPLTEQATPWWQQGHNAAVVVAGVLVAVAVFAVVRPKSEPERCIRAAFTEPAIARAADVPFNDAWAVESKDRTALGGRIWFVAGHMNGETAVFLVQPLTAQPAFVFAADPVADRLSSWGDAGAAVTRPDSREGYAVAVACLAAHAPLR